MITVKVPDSWAEVTVGQYQEIANLNKDSSDKSLLVASILCDKDPEEIRKYDLQSYNAIMNALSWVSELPTEEYKPIITIDGIEYGFINRLTELSTGNWIDLEEYIKDYNNNIHKILAMFYRPLVTALSDEFRITEDYDTTSAGSRSELFSSKMNISDCYGSLVFFSLIANECIATLKDYLTSQINQTQTKQKKKNVFGSLKKRLALNGVGTTLFTPWQKEILQKLSLSRR